MRRGGWRLRSVVQVAVSIVLVVFMAGMVGAVWTGVLAPQGPVATSGGDRGEASGSRRAGAPDRRPATAGAPVAPPDAMLWLTFDRRVPDAPGPLQLLDVRSRWRATEHSIEGGRLSFVPGPPGRGHAIRPRTPCSVSAKCPAGLAVVPDADSLDPGAADFSFGASVRLLPMETGGGGNVVEKGWLQAPGGQWTLNVDALDGHPSCVVEGRLEGPTQVIVRSRVTVADGAWHSVSCHKTAESVRIVVDGTEDELTESIGDVANTAPILIGGSGLDAGDATFHGRVDDVYLWIDRAPD